MCITLEFASTPSKGAGLSFLCACESFAKEMETSSYSGSLHVEGKFLQESQVLVVGTKDYRIWKRGAWKQEKGCEDI